jgi:MFS family permease
MQKRKLVIIATVVCTLLVWPLVKLLPIDSSDPSTHGQFGALVASSMLVVINCSAVGLFILALKKFTDELKAAYTVISIGLVAYAIAQFQIPLILLLGLRESFYMVSGLAVVPTIVGIITMYAGVRRFAKLLDVNSWWYKWRTVWLSSIVAAVLAAFLPAPAAQPADTIITFKATVAIVAWGTVFSIANTALLFRIKRAIGQIYHQALHWFFMSTLVSVFAGLIALAAFFSLGSLHPLVNSYFLFVPQILAGVAVLCSAYAFSAIGLLEPETTKDGERHTKKGATTVTSIDIVTCVAQLASNPLKIDPLLDKVRIITATSDHPDKLTASQEAELLAVYKSLEDYLVHQESVRKFTPEEVRQLVSKQLDLRSDSDTILDRVAS